MDFITSEEIVKYQSENIIARLVTRLLRDIKVSEKQARGPSTYYTIANIS